jgi:hypothetical protein
LEWERSCKISWELIDSMRAAPHESSKILLSHLGEMMAENFSGLSAKGKDGNPASEYTISFADRSTIRWSANHKDA